MISDRIRKLRIESGISQSELARKLSVTHSSVNAWEMGFSAPTAQYIIELAKLFHSSSDYILGLSNKNALVLDNLSDQEIKLIRDLLSYMDSH